MAISPGHGRIPGTLAIGFVVLHGFTVVDRAGQNLQLTKMNAPASAFKVLAPEGVMLVRLTIYGKSCFATISGDVVLDYLLHEACPVWSVFLEGRRDRPLLFILVGQTIRTQLTPATASVRRMQFNTRQTFLGTAAIAQRPARRQVPRHVTSKRGRVDFLKLTASSAGLNQVVEGLQRISQKYLVVNWRLATARAFSLVAVSEVEKIGHCSA